MSTETTYICDRCGEKFPNDDKIFRFSTNKEPFFEDVCSDCMVRECYDLVNYIAVHIVDHEFARADCNRIAEEYRKIRAAFLHLKEMVE